MQLTAFRVRNFRNIVDSGLVPVDPEVTCLVGKNEAGKSGLLEALYLFNPPYGETFDAAEQFPRWLSVQARKAGKLEEHTPIEVHFVLEQADMDVVNESIAAGVLTSSSLKIAKKYDGGTMWTFEHDDAPAIKALLDDLDSEVQQVFRGISTLEEAIAAASQSAGESGPSAEQIAALKNAIKAVGYKDGRGVRQAVENVLSERLPKFFRFTQYSTLPGRVDLQALAKNAVEGPGRSAQQTARALLSLAGTTPQQLSEEDYELRRGELEAVQIDLTRQVFEYWKQNPDLEVVIDVDKENRQHQNGTTAVSRYLDIRLRDKRTGYSNNFSQRSSGFQWFFSFLAAFSEFDDKNAPIVLLDEPALTLHGKAQADFLRFINERLAPNAPVLYTTHSPFMVEAGRLERVRVVEDLGPPKGSVCSTDVLASDPSSLFPLQAALGYDIAQSLFVGPHNLVVEGTSDYIYLTLLSQLCRASNREALDARWRILPAGGATNIPTFVSLVGPHLDVTVVADSDTQGMQRVTNMQASRLLKTHRLILAKVATGNSDADLEDLFTEGDYLKLYNGAHGTSIKVADLPAGNRVVKRLESKAGKFVHGEVAEHLLRTHVSFKPADTTLDRFEALFKAINATLGT